MRNPLRTTACIAGMVPATAATCTGPSNANVTNNYTCASGYYKVPGPPFCTRMYCDFVAT
jgi:hypothetical protein